MAFTGAEPVRAETLQRFAAGFAESGFQPQVFYPCYGMAEATLLVTGGDCSTRPQELVVDTTALANHHVAAGSEKGGEGRTLVSCGSTVPDQTLRVVDPDTGIPCKPDRIGEIWVSGPSVAQGYWQRPELTQTTFDAYLADESEAGPFLRTGDLGFLHQGELYVTGRLKDLLIFRGQNHYPQDIEATVATCHPALRADAGAAIAVELAGEERLVVVQELERQHRRNPNVAEIVAAMRQAIAQAHDLQLYGLVLLKPGGLPKTTSGKVQRFACRENFLNQSLEAIATWTAAADNGHAVGEDTQPNLKGVSEWSPVAANPEMSAGEPVANSATKSAAAIETWTIARLAEQLQIPPAEIDPNAEFVSLGLDSATIVGLSGELETWLERRLSPILLYDYPTIRQLARYLASESQLPETVTNGTAGAESSAPAAPTEEIAIIGLDCRFPGAESPEAFWELLQTGGDAITVVPSDRAWPTDSGFAAANLGGFLSDIDRFDAAFFSITPREALRLDPQQRLLLETAWTAFERAGQTRETLAGSRTGVFIGISGSDYGRQLAQSTDYWDAYAGTGNALSVAANRLSYFFDLRGPSLAIDTACSSSLVAIHQAVRSLRQGECDLAIAGGTNAILSPALTVAFAKAQMMAADGRCKTFDAEADGYVRGEGCGQSLERNKAT
ncbi:MAG: beta-ketoacyl synthase N-terminal-like domain-containing protein, partial [Cyanobacteria bacterium J06641_5]